MNVYRAAALLDKADLTSRVKGRPVNSLTEVKTYDTNTNRVKKKAAFLQAFEKNGSIALSAQLAGIDRTTHYEWVAKDANYKAAFEMLVLMATDAIRDELVSRARNGVFKPHIYKGNFCYESRMRTICQLADGTSAFQDELPRGAKVIGSHLVKVHDGAIIGRTRRNAGALLKAVSLLVPEFRDIRLRVRKPRAR